MTNDGAFSLTKTFSKSQMYTIQENKGTYTYKITPRKTGAWINVKGDTPDVVKCPFANVMGMI